MAKLFLLAATAALYLHLSLAYTAPSFVIQGRVYCDNCRAGFETNVTEYIEGAKVKLECRHFANHTIAHTNEGVTDKLGAYSLQLEDDHQEEICEVVLVDSPLKDCNEIKSDRSRAHVLLTRDNGIDSPVRYANSLGFLKAEPLIVCGQLLRQYLLADEDM